MANSPGWIEKPPILIHSLAPLISEYRAGSSAGISTSTMPARPSVYAYRDSARWSRTISSSDRGQHHRGQRPGELPDRRCRRRRVRSARSAGGDRGQVEPAQEGHAEAVDQGDRRQQHRVGVRREEPDRHVHARGRRRPSTAAGTQKSRRDRVEHAGLDRGRVDGDQHHREDRAAPARRCAGCGSPGRAEARPSVRARQPVRRCGHAVASLGSRRGALSRTVGSRPGRSPAAPGRTAGRRASWRATAVARSRRCRRSAGRRRPRSEPVPAAAGRRRRRRWASRSGSAEGRTA